MRTLLGAVVGVVCSVAFAGCQPAKKDKSVPGTMTILHGPAGAASFAPANATLAPTDGFWKVSPDAGTLHLLSLSFRGADGLSNEVPLTDCNPTYQRSGAALSHILDCPFSVPAGTYIGFGINMSTVYDLKIDDAVNGMYTDPATPSLLATTPPAGGAQFVSVDFGFAGETTVGLNYSLPTPLVVGSADSITISATADMIHLTEVNVVGGVPEFRHDGVVTPVLLFGTPAGLSATEYYSTLATTESYNYSNPPIDGQSIRVFYSAGQAASLGVSPTSFFASGGTGYAFAADAATQTADNLGNKAGGFLGVDGSGTLCWAQAATFSFENYTNVYAIDRVATVGSSATLVRQPVTSTPQPSSGSTYTSGCPVLATNGSLSMTLIAH